jgi:hypothetical protein
LPQQFCEISTIVHSITKYLSKYPLLSQGVEIFEYWIVMCDVTVCLFFQLNVSRYFDANKLSLSIK